MQFITVSLAALTLGANVFAAPTSLYQKAGDVVAVEADASATLNKKDLSLFPSHHRHDIVDVDVNLEGRDVVQTVESIPVAGPTVSKVSGVVAKLTPETVVSILGSAVGTLKSELQTDCSGLTTLVSADSTASVVPKIEATLSHMVVVINSTMAAVGPAVADITADFSAAEVEHLVASLTDIKTTISTMEATLHSMVSTVEADAMVMIKPEVVQVLALVTPLASPITHFAVGVAGTLNESSGELVAACTGVTAAVHSLLDPVSGLLSALL